ncbi:hypothetical protein RIR_jg33444.t1 [Rhizophagus irregularis DAOM 181602=DAOM 197198]|uniref:Uncharacterized protein n=1 Tax=Rhizophagus irregularis (strain DAOM 181602 / DAOM 197198 / MUCL 43194) TaxID=747089 RepID=U9UVJ6_RHIID|nr:hypothetical protein RIR_jg33444.t1 [Rhizophagus irregularis DAOM 181602=DAOM 197198]
MESAIKLSTQLKKSNEMPNYSKIQSQVQINLRHEPLSIISPIVVILAIEPMVMQDTELMESLNSPSQPPEVGEISLT